MWSPDGSFIVVGDALGTVHFLDVVSRSVVFSQQIQPKTATPAHKTFVGMSFMCVPLSKTNTHPTNPPPVCDRGNESKDLAVVLHDHIVFYFSNVDLGRLRQALVARNAQLAKDVKASIQVSKVNVATMTSVGHAAFDTNNIILTAASGANNSTHPLGIWTKRPGHDLVQTDGLSASPMWSGIGKVVNSFDGKSILTLNGEGKLQQWDRRRYGILCLVN